jgi:hypothetical protein
LKRWFFKVKNPIEVRGKPISRRYHLSSNLGIPGLVRFPERPDAESQNRSTRPKKKI